ncbi:MAG: hypothetical protein ABJ205_10265 [Erythrobacter sp.]|uniref:hypothetical protein n=1 Tax=Erythrobacter sp. TaxID=1042 RepID=UPI00326474F3
MIDDDLQNGVSEITEINEGSGLNQFVVSVGCGILAGTLAMLIGLGLKAGFDTDLANFGAAVVFVGLFVAIFTFMGFVAIGLPITWLLKAMGKETVAVYSATGAITGFLATAVIFEVHRQPTDMLLFPAVGAVAGFACAYPWGRWREGAAQRRNVAKEIVAQRRTNPIHDLTH